MLIVLAVVLVGGLAYWFLMSPYSQLFGRYPYRVKTREKIIALTLDDGPNEPYTSDLADFLKDRGVKATFFEVGDCVRRHPEVSRRLIADGHVIGNHSVSHQFHQYFMQLNFKQQIERNQDIIETAIGKRPALYRSPWLLRQPWLFATLRRNGLQPVSGTFCHVFEVAQIPAARIAKRALAHAKPGAIIIFHDGVEGRGGNRAQTIAAVKIFVDELLAQGYRFATVDELLNIPAYKQK
jgi:peptidoglycan/xylan/chitin deacetylase (PgdA/CDA1 family)